MDRRRRKLIVLQLVGGPAVLASYVLGALAWPEATAQMWGGVPEALRPLYTAWMFVAALGYLLVTGLFVFRVEPEDARLLGGRGYGLLLPIYALILLPSALWLPLTRWQLGDPSLLRFALVWLDLLAVALGALALIAAVFSLRPRPPARLRTPALLGAVGFAIQTVILDGLLWPLWFPHSGSKTMGSEAVMSAIWPALTSM